MALRILGTGSYLPPKVVTNDDLAKTLDTSDEWIFSHTGIHSRHLAGPDECTSSMAAAAGSAALAAAGVKPEDVNLVIVATSSPDYNVFPSVACLAQHAMGCVNAAAYDLLAACTGFVYALEQARCWCIAHPGAKVVVIGAETLSRTVDWKDRASCILFGDGAGAVVVGDSAEGPSSKAFLYSDGSGWADIVRKGGTHDAPPADGKMDYPMMSLQGHAVFNFAVRTVTATIRTVAEAEGMGPEGFDLIFAHQANWRIIESVSRRLKVPLEKFYMTIQDTGNTSGASIPIALDRAVREGVLKDGMKICLVGFGAGHTWGGTSVVWPLV